jgi:hypothetical protein
MITFIKTRHVPDLRRLGTEIFSSGGVLAMLCSPDDVTIQLRRAKDFMSVNLTTVEARELGKQLIALADAP